MYIKLDKKLIVSAEKIDLATNTNTQTSLNEIKNLLENLPYLYSLFESISIQKLILQNNTIRFLYKDRVFYVDSDFITIDAQVKPWEDSIEFFIEYMKLKDYEIQLNGNLKIFLKNKTINFQGQFNTFNIDGNLNARLENNILYYRLSTGKFTTLKPFMDYLSNKINLDALIGDWIYKKIVASEYKLDNLEGKFNLETNEFYPNLMSGKAQAKNVVVKFDKNAPVVIADDINIKLKNNELLFDIKKASYEGKDVSNSDVYIDHLMSKGVGINIDIKADTMLDESIHKTLKAFDIDIPIVQTSGTTKTNVLLDIRFDPLDVKSYKGTFNLVDSNISISGVPMYSKKATVILDNNLVHVKNSNLKHNSLFDINTTGQFDINKGLYSSKNNINSLNINLGENEVINLKDFKTNATLELKKDEVDIDLKKLNTLLKFKENKNEFSIYKVDNLYNYSSIMQKLELNNANINIKTKDFTLFNIYANLQGVNLPLSKNGKKIKDIEVNITTDGKKFKLESLDKKIILEQKENLDIKIEDLDIEVDTTKINTQETLKDMNIIGINSNLIDSNTSRKLISDYFALNTIDGNITLNTYLINHKIFYNKTKSKLLIQAKNLNDIFVNSLLAKNSFKDGNFSLDINGSDHENFTGNFIAQDTTIKGISLYNNIIAFINTIPSLVTLKNPGFNENGYGVKNILIHFTRNDNILSFDKILLDGDSTDVIGSGTADLSTNNLNLHLQIEVLKSLSSVVQKIPVVGYIFLGDDGKIFTQIDVKGTLDKPEITTNVLKDTAISPYNIIKRTIQSPIQIFK